MSATTTRANGIDFVMFLVNDVSKARTFYETLLGVVPGDHNSDYFVEYVLPDGSAFAIANDPSSERIQCGGAVFGVTDLEASARVAREAGATVLRQYGGDVCSSYWCLDPDGNPFGLHQRK